MNFPEQASKAGQDPPREHVASPHSTAPTPLILDPLLSKAEVKRLCTISSDSTLYSLIRKGAFPAPITLTDSGSRVAWPQSRIASWIEARKDLAAQLGTAGRALGPKLRQLVADQ